jgi:hypothetical protein
LGTTQSSIVLIFFMEEIVVLLHLKVDYPDLGVSEQNPTLGVQHMTGGRSGR